MPDSCSICSGKTARGEIGPPILFINDGRKDVAAVRRWREELGVLAPFLMEQVEHVEHIDTRYAESRADSVEQIHLQDPGASQPALQLGYNTTDYLGSDGDDTPHIPYPTIMPPNIVGATIGPPTSTPTSIDVVYNEFMESE